MNQSEINSRLIALVGVASDYCLTLEQAADFEKDDFVGQMLHFLPQLYYEFIDIDVEESASLESMEYEMAPPSYVDEDYYDSIRRRVETVMGPDDTFLETFEEDMKYSDTPVAASIAESLADIFQPLYNFVSSVKESEGERLLEAYEECRENFEAYWSQTLCNVLRALNNLRFSNSPQ